MVSVFAAEPIGAGPTFLGAQACASSGCHGGGKENQFLVWSLRDFHSQRPFATLTTARSKQIGEALGIKDPPVEKRCTTCHAPLAEVPESRRGPAFKVTEAVSCESCHHPAEQWLRSHTRPDYTHADRVAAGMRDLKNLYVRANTCVACHQTVELPLLKAGHPELIFELDGQSDSEPKHWRETTNWNGAQAWLVGQAAALREMYWQLSQSPEKNSRLALRAEALLWLFQKLAKIDRAGALELNALGTLSAADLDGTRRAADRIARRSAELPWPKQATEELLRSLADTSGDFRRADISREQHARRAERLVIALDRLTVDRPRGDKKLNELFDLSQSLPDFDPARFATALEEFAKAALK